MKVNEMALGQAISMFGEPQVQGKSMRTGLRGHTWCFSLQCFEEQKYLARKRIESGESQAPQMIHNHPHGAACNSACVALVEAKPLDRPLLDSGLLA
jgi:hypothetical protein